MSVTMLAKLVEQQDTWLPFLIVAILLVAGAALWVLDRHLLGRPKEIDVGRLAP